MSQVRFLPLARQDLHQIWEYIARDNIDAADRVVAENQDACHRLTVMPDTGHHREDLTTKPYLFWPVRSYLIIYRPEAKPLEIIAVLHGARDVPRIIENR